MEPFDGPLKLSVPRVERDAGDGVKPNLEAAARLADEAASGAHLFAQPS